MLVLGHRRRRLKTCTLVEWCAAPEPSVHWAVPALCFVVWYTVHGGTNPGRNKPEAEPCRRSCAREPQSGGSFRPKCNNSVRESHTQLLCHTTSGKEMPPLPPLLQTPLLLTVVAWRRRPRRRRQQPAARGAPVRAAGDPPHQPLLLLLVVLLLLVLPLHLVLRQQQQQ